VGKKPDAKVVNSNYTNKFSRYKKGLTTPEVKFNESDVNYKVKEITRQLLNRNIGVDNYCEVLREEGYNPNLENVSILCYILDQ
jgi:hypothetical protein